MVRSRRYHIVENDFATTVTTKGNSAQMLNKVFILLIQVGDLQSSFSAVNKSLEAFPDHWDSKDLLQQLRQELAAL